jgi:hypothetical protein
MPLDYYGLKHTGLYRNCYSSHYRDCGPSSSPGWHTIHYAGNLRARLFCKICCFNLFAYLTSINALTNVYSKT